MDLEVEKSLVSKAKKDPQAFGRLFDFYYPKIYGYILKRTANVALAEDITSETFFKALKKLDTFKWRGVPFSAWLYKIAINETNSYFRKNKINLISLEHALEEQGLEVPDLNTPEIEVIALQEELERKEIYILLQKNILKLSVKYQEVLTLRYFDDKKISEIAEILGKKEGTVKSLLSRGHEKLRSNLDLSKMQPISTSGVIATEVEK